jgi:2-keto-3-deoxy-L-rhamnonate aldolase RhmA
MYQPLQRIFAIWVSNFDESLAWCLRTEAERRDIPLWYIPDVQHGLWTWRQLELFCILSFPAKPLIRIPEITPNAIVQALQCGARGIMVPQVFCEEQARSIVEYSYFPPMGRRSKGGTRFDNRWETMPTAEYFKEAKSIFIILQIEDIKAIPQLNEIMSVEGIDGLFIGVEDLCLSHGSYGNVNKTSIPWDQPIVWEVAEKLEELSKKFGKCWGMPITPSLYQQKILNKAERALFLAIGAGHCGLNDIKLFV